MERKTFNIFLALVLSISLFLVSCGESPSLPVETGDPASMAGSHASTPAGPPEATAGPNTPTPSPEDASTPTPVETLPVWSKGLKQAVAAAIDREALVDRVFEGHNTPAYHMVPAGYPYFSEPFFNKYGTRDLDLAVQLLSDLGFSRDRPFELDLWYPLSDFSADVEEVAQIIKEQLEDTRLIDLHLKARPWDEYLTSIAEAEMPLFLLGWAPDFVDPDNWLSPFASCEMSPLQGVNYCQPEMEELLQRAAASQDTAEREELYRQIGELYALEVPTLPLFWEQEYLITRDGVEGTVIGPAQDFYFHRLRFADKALPASGSPDTIIMGTTQEIQTFDPRAAGNGHDLEILNNIGLTLLRYEPGTTDLAPGAASRLPTLSDNGQTYTFTLKSGLQFSDGTPLTAQEYRAAWQRLVELDNQASRFFQQYIEKVEAPEDHTLVFHVKQAYAFFPALAASPHLIPLHPADLDAFVNGRIPSSMEGSGFYRMASYEPGVEMALEANPHAAGEEAAFIPNVIVRYYSDASALAGAIESGEVDIAWRTVGPLESLRLQTIAGLSVEPVEMPALHYLVFNHGYEAAVP